MKTKQALATLTLAVILGFIIGVSASNFAHIPTSTIVRSIDVSVTWLDDTPVTSLDWGLADSGVETPLPAGPIKITNTGTAPITLTLDTQNWSSGITTLLVTWDYDNIAIPAGNSVQILLKQTITGPPGPYTYTTVITGVEAT